MRLEGRVAIVTGGAVRLGRAMAIGLASEGMDVCVHYHRSEAEAQRTVAEILAMGRRAMAARADLMEWDAAERVVASATRDLGRPDVLVNSAAIFEPSTTDSFDALHFDRHVGINMRGPLAFCQSFARSRELSDEAHIVNIVDWRALHPCPGHLVYTMTKAAIVALTRILAAELAPHIRVNAIAPGAVLLPPGASGDAARTIATRVPLGRMGRPSDVVGALVYLLKSDFVTGEVLSVTGGEPLRRG